MIYILRERLIDITGTKIQQHWFQIGEYPESLRLINVYPCLSWQKEHGVISTFKGSLDMGRVDRVVQLSEKTNKGQDILIIL
jgi:hypothetical protein